MQISARFYLLSCVVSVVCEAEIESEWDREKEILENSGFLSSSTSLLSFFFFSQLCACCFVVQWFHSTIFFSMLSSWLLAGEKCKFFLEQETRSILLQGIFFKILINFLKTTQKIINSNPLNSVWVIRRKVELVHVVWHFCYFTYKHRLVLNKKPTLQMTKRL